MKRTGFTLVEILIVVIILGILAAIVIPQFTEASNDARKSALVSDLQTMRSQIELYKVQHGERLPCVDENNAAVDATGTMDRLTKSTNQLGAIGTDPLLFPLGPYLQRMPTNPFVTPTTNGNQILLVPALTNPLAGTGATGWWFNPTTGACGPNDTVNFAL